MKYLVFFLSFFGVFFFAQNIHGIQLFNPQTNDETPVITKEQYLILNFDDLGKTESVYRYTIKHLDRNWKDDGLFFSEFAEGLMNDVVDSYEFSFNTSQRYTHYTLRFPNQKIKPKISGNYELIIYKKSASDPVFRKKFFIVETSNNIAVNVERFSDAQKPLTRQRLRIVVQGIPNIQQNLQSLGLSVIQNNNQKTALSNLNSFSISGSQLLFQQENLVFPGNNQFYYFDNKNLTTPMNTISQITRKPEGTISTYLYPIEPYPIDYNYNPDVNGAFYFRRNDSGIERNSSTEADYSWVVFSLVSENLISDELYVLGGFNDYKPTNECKMTYDSGAKKYIAKIYLKQGFYNYTIAVKSPKGNLNFSEINGNFWQTQNLYQAFLYYSPQNGNYDGIASYGEYRPKR